MKGKIVDLVAGARPNFVKLAPVVKALREDGQLVPRIVHTGQHYHEGLSDVFFAQLGIPAPDVHLEVGSGTHGVQTARILERYETHVMASRPVATVVFGDVNSTVACGLAAVKLGVPVVHVEAGLRSFDRSMPEEINRLLTDALSDLLLVSEPSGLKHLQREGVPKEKVHLVGNTMIDTLLGYLPRARARDRASELRLTKRQYGLLTLHRPSNVDEPEVLKRLMACFESLNAQLPIVFPVHPRTRAALERAGIAPSGSVAGRLVYLEPQGYLENLSLMADAALVLTDSGGMQEETAVLGVPCITLRENTERPVTVEVGASRLVGNNPERIAQAFEDVVQGTWAKPGDIPLWDGRAGERIVAVLADWLEVQCQ
ncbi:MAG: UDP-N-acetylglucosamine 2-epimerase (non-hydrolyzing) [Gammaproteobacteria bacterium]